MCLSCCGRVHSLKTYSFYKRKPAPPERRGRQPGLEIQLFARIRVVVAHLAVRRVVDAGGHSQPTGGVQVPMLSPPGLLEGVVGPAAVDQDLGGWSRGRLRSFDARRGNSRRRCGSSGGKHQSRSSGQNNKFLHHSSPGSKTERNATRTTLPWKLLLRQINYDTGNQPVALRLVATEWVSGSPRPVSQTSLRLWSAFSH